MKYQPSKGFVSNDDVQTPIDLAFQVVYHFLPWHASAFECCDPCCGDGAFYDAMRERAGEYVSKGDIKTGQDFLALKRTDDTDLFRWIITNPPWSKFRSFLLKAMELKVPNIVFLISLNHAIGLKARLRDLDEHGYAIREILLVDTPSKPWPQSGFQLAAVHWQKGKQKAVKWSDGRKKLLPK